MLLHQRWCSCFFGGGKARREILFSCCKSLMILLAGCRWRTFPLSSFFFCCFIALKINILRAVSQFSPRNFLCHSGFGGRFFNGFAPLLADIVRIRRKILLPWKIRRCWRSKAFWRFPWTLHFRLTIEKRSCPLTFGEQFVLLMRTANKSWFRLL